MKQIKVNMIRLQPFQLLIENALRILHTVYRPERKLGRQIEGISVIFLQHLTHQRLALSVVIRIGCIYVVHACGDRSVQHPLRFCLVYFAIRQSRETHTAKAQKRCLNSKFLHFSFFHNPSPFQLSPGAAHRNQALPVLTASLLRIIFCPFLL